METQNKIVVVGIGPGNPDYIVPKGLKAIEKAKAVKCRPSMIILDTIKSKGYAPGEGIRANHSMPISPENEEYAVG